jgi:hypothetical protein
LHFILSLNSNFKEIFNEFLKAQEKGYVFLSKETRGTLKKMNEVFTCLDNKKFNDDQLMKFGIANHIDICSLFEDVETTITDVFNTNLNLKYRFESLPGKEEKEFRLKGKRLFETLILPE